MDQTTLQFRPVASVELPDDEETRDRLFAYLERNRPTMDEIKRAICEFYVISRCDLESRCRDRLLIVARQLFCYFSHRYARKSLGQIKLRIGYSDHTTVAHAIRRVERYAITCTHYEEHTRTAGLPMIRDDLDLLRLRIVEKVLLRRAGSDPC
jgi:chromosomal replication initiation ATPase DnaA